MMAFGTPPLPENVKKFKVVYENKQGQICTAYPTCEREEVGSILKSLKELQFKRVVEVTAFGCGCTNCK